MLGYYVNMCFVLMTALYDSEIKINAITLWFMLGCSEMDFEIVRDTLVKMNYITIDSEEMCALTHKGIRLVNRFPASVLQN